MIPTRGEETAQGLLEASSNTDVVLPALLHGQPGLERCPHHGWAPDWELLYLPVSHRGTGGPSVSLSSRKYI